jgi:hypothetical protein
MVWMSYLWKTKIGRLSFQVLTEFYETVTHKLQPGMDIQSARDDGRYRIALAFTYLDAFLRYFHFLPIRLIIKLSVVSILIIWYEQNVRMITHAGEISD